MKILYNKKFNEYFLMTNNNDEFYFYDKQFIYENLLEKLLEKIKNTDLEYCEFIISNIESDETVIFETDSKKELLNLPNTHPELFI